MEHGVHQLLQQHEARQLVAALLICASSSAAAISLLAYLRTGIFRARRLWLGCAAMVAGFGVWATHFVSMLGYHAASESSFAVGLTLASLAVVVLGLHIAFSGLLHTRRQIEKLGYGMFAGLSVVAMHYVGMAGFLPGQPSHWNNSLVTLSVVAGIGIGAIFGLYQPRDSDLGQRGRAAALFSLLTVVVHFTGMAAFSLHDTAMPGMLAISGAASHWLDVTIMLVVISIVIASYVAITIDSRSRAIRVEMSHMQELVEATIEALLICDEGVVSAVNANFAVLAGSPESALIGKSVSALLELPQGGLSRIRALRPVEAVLIGKGDTRIEVEIVAREVAFGGKPQTAIAVRDIRLRKQAEHEILQLANFDNLTQLPNRRRFYQLLRESIEAAGANGRSLALLCIDLDHFKEINDQHGHNVGDDFLRRAARVMESVLGDGEFLGRVGGDEFALVLPAISDPGEAGEVAEAILAAFASDSLTTGNSINLAATIGISIFPRDAAAKTELIAAADIAMYRAKQDARGTYRYFDAALAHEMRERRQIEQDLRAADHDRHFHLVYQPQVDCVTGTVTGMEALLRWHHPVRGEVPPSQFIPIAEDCGEIGRIGDWVLECAAREAAAWPEPHVVAVNVSSVQIVHRDLPGRIHELLLQTGLPPSRLEIEITETAIVRDFNRALATLRRIKALGVRIVMDDFGTGYSSLYTLRSFPFDKIKVDSSFVRAVDRDGQSAAIVKAVIGLGQGLGVPVLAEGVETEQEHRFLREAGCAQLQGYLFGRPARYEDLAAAIRTSRAA